MSLSLINKLKLWNVRRRFLLLHKKMTKDFNEKKINIVESTWEERSNFNSFSNDSILANSVNIKKSIDDKLFFELIELIELADKPSKKILDSRVPSEFVYEMI